MKVTCGRARSARRPRVVFREYDVPLEPDALASPRADRHDGSDWSLAAPSP